MPTLQGALVASKILDWLPTRTVLNGTFVLSSVALATISAAGSPTVMAIPVMVLGVAAPISWAATTHVAARTVEARNLAMVMGGAGGGVGLGVIINGALVWVSSGPEAWRWAFLVAALMSMLVTVASLVLFRRPVERPSTGAGVGRAGGSYRRVLSQWAGRVVVIASVVTGVTAFTFNSFLTTTAIEEMVTSSVAAGALLWAMGTLGVIASVYLGRASDRGSPVPVVSWMFLVCGTGLGLVTVVWTYFGLMVAALGIAILNFPVWGLVAAIASRRFEPPEALRAVALGLVGASDTSAVGSVLAGRWIDSVGSMRLPVALMALATLTVGWWTSGRHGSHAAE
ncbi:MAG: MFS transporter [Acidimicrobiia bacterium]